MSPTSAANGAPSGTGTPLFHARGLTKTYRMGEIAVHALQGVDLDLFERDLVVIHCTMSGRHVNPFADYDEKGEIRTVFPPTGRRFATTQSHWVRIRDGKMVEHWANRDDLGTAMQLGWVPPSPLYLFKAARTKRRMRRARRA